MFWNNQDSELTLRKIIIFSIKITQYHDGYQFNCCQINPTRWTMHIHNWNNRNIPMDIIIRCNIIDTVSKSNTKSKSVSSILDVSWQISIQTASNRSHVLWHTHIQLIQSKSTWNRRCSLWYSWIIDQTCYFLKSLKLHEIRLNPAWIPLLLLSNRLKYIKHT